MKTPNFKRVRSIVKSERDKMRDRAAKGDFFAFIHYVNSRYRANWHHRLLATKLEEFYNDPSRSRLMVFMPPQHGKSEQASRLFPAYVLGVNPDCKIAACSYSADLSRAFNRDVQRIMDSTPNYCEVFPGTRLNGARVSADSRGGTLRNTNEFEIVNRLGSYKSVGVGGGLSGRAVDLMIIDDPVKDAKEAHSTTVRESVWSWYQSVAETRLHNKSKVVVIMTRWHEDDLAGRLLATEPEKWQVVSLPAIREQGGPDFDPRSAGEALWPDRHSLERLLAKEKQSAWVFAALYQQRPAPIGGGMIKPSWFPTYQPSELPRQPTHFYLDTAYTAKQKNDPTGILAGVTDGQRLYLRNFKAVRLEFPELVKFIPRYVKQNGGDHRSKVVIEPKASGLSIIQQLRRETNLNVIADDPPKDDKVAGTAAVSSIMEGGRVLVPAGENWVGSFLDQLGVFPNGTHDEEVDCIKGLINRTLIKKQGRRTLRGAS